jgi:hypothetical protein
MCNNVKALLSVLLNVTDPTVCYVHVQNNVISIVSKCNYFSPFDHIFHSVYRVFQKRPSLFTKPALSLVYI